MNATSVFVTDNILKPEEICNLQNEKQVILDAVIRSEKILVYGRRNTGKTSVVKNYIGSKWQELHKNSLFIYVDFFGVKSLRHISTRLTAAFTEAYKKQFAIKAQLNSALDLIKKLRPKLEVGADGLPSLSLGVDHEDSVPSISSLLKTIGSLTDKKIPCFLAFDEFQDVHEIEESEGILRGELQSLPSAIPIILMGSKQHILGQMFFNAKAAFYQWGKHVEFGPIDYKEYTRYMNIQFKKISLRIEPVESQYLQDFAFRNPESINRICQWLYFHPPKNSLITKQNIDQAFTDIVDARRSAAEEYLSHLSPSEEKILTFIAHSKEAIVRPLGKNVVSQSGLSVGGVKKAFSNLQNIGAIYRNDKRFEINDPFIGAHLKRFR